MAWGKTATVYLYLAATRGSMLLATIAAAAAIAAPAPSSAMRSATIARDLGGFELGMPIARARQLAALESIGNGEFEATVDGVKYDVAVSGLGRIYRVTSSQPLGRFTPDKKFLDELRGKLVSKFGPPTQATGDTFKWEVIEIVPHTDGTRLPFTTNWASAVLLDGVDGVSLDMTLLDFRVMWADAAKLNAGPRERAAGEVHL